MMATFTSVSAFADHVAGYADRISRADEHALKAELEAITIIVKKHGSRYRIKGRGGKKWPLGAKQQGPYGYAGSHLGYVSADPMGFWTLVEKGSHNKPGGWDIYPRKLGARARRNAIRRGDKIQERGGIFAAGYSHPMRFVHHPGFGSIGHPWEQAMVEARVVGPRVYEAALVRSVFAAAA